ncbi:adenylate/guanylate cyclase domain-containing protein [Neosynechococcus sphagnicola]|uniref:adenylate/guanylate cyclase domain-containing protein n=1 Tax=Neosynechococcus sphagnicola TaxID=1501145 RepID=UPI00068E4A53|nr:adenylate/guanylate cyclase domain-containing protein [Neosynechococcus sphagnicola]
MLAKDASLGIVFADISGSTSLYERLGNVVAQQIIKQYLSLIFDVVIQYGGTVVKTIGDEVMSYFPTADLAVGAASEMQSCLQESSVRSQVALSLRIGVNFGPVIQESGDVFGDVVNVAARVVALAKPGQILTTDQTFQALTMAYRSNVRFMDCTPVKGRKQPINLYEVLWQASQSVLTVANFSQASSATPGTHLQLRYLGHQLELTPDLTELSLGREPGNDLVVENKMASRRHAIIEYSRGKFYLKDQSVNGTYVSTAEGVVHLRREELVLVGSGVIGLGCLVSADMEDAIHFCCS